MQKEFDKLNVLNGEIMKGFTLIEALIGMAIILIAVIGPLSVTVKGIKTITQNKNRIIASYLAEEMVEEFRNYRDHFAVACENYTPGLEGEALTSATCGSLNVLGVATIKDSGQQVAWKLFLNRIGLDSNLQKVYAGIIGNPGLDQDSFNEIDSINSHTHDSCLTLYLNINNYSCTDGSNSASTIFARTVTLTKISNTAIKIEVLVPYAKSYLSGTEDRFVDVIDYIYER